jgi:hypothetical protein
VSQERYIERLSLEWLKRTLPKAKAPKSTTPGWPDRQILLGKGRHVWVEFKTPTGRLTPLQEAVHRDLRSNGDEVHVIRSTREFRLAVGAAYRAVWASD